MRLILKDNFDDFFKKYKLNEMFDNFNAEIYRNNIHEHIAKIKESLASISKNIGVNGWVVNTVIRQIENNDNFEIKYHIKNINEENECLSGEILFLNEVGNQYTRQYPKNHQDKDKIDFLLFFDLRNKSLKDRTGIFNIDILNDNFNKILNFNENYRKNFEFLNYYLMINESSFKWKTNLRLKDLTGMSDLFFNLISEILKKDMYFKILDSDYSTNFLQGKISVKDLNEFNDIENNKNLDTFKVLMELKSFNEKESLKELNEKLKSETGLSDEMLYEYLSYIDCLGY